MAQESACGLLNVTHDMGMNATLTYRQTELANARAKSAEARAAYAAATTKRAKRDAAEAIEFWGNKAAFLANVKGWEG